MRVYIAHLAIYGMFACNYGDWVGAWAHSFALFYANSVNQQLVVTSSETNTTNKPIQNWLSHL